LPGERILNEAGIPTFAYPDTAARVFNYMWRYNYNLRGIYETPVLTDEGTAGARRYEESPGEIVDVHPPRRAGAAYGV
jgi:acetyltransferase